MRVVNRIWAIVVCEDEDITHTRENGYECDDSECICHECEEAEDRPFPLFLPSTEEAMENWRVANGR